MSFDVFGEPIGSAYCLAPSTQKVEDELGWGVPEECPILQGLVEVDEDE
jgi:hypothetical protein